MLWKCCTQYASKFGKLSSGHRIGKGQFSFQSQRRAMPQNVPTTIVLISHASKVCSKSLMLEASAVCELRTWRCTSWVPKRQRNQRSHCQYFFLIMGKAKEFQKNIYFCFSNYTKAFDFDHAQQEMGVPDYLTCLLRNLYVGQEATVRIGHGTAD